jgi:DNA-binding NarL/FixJ family response regulator
MPLDAESHTPAISPEEVELVSLVGRGWTDERIARALGISRTTVQRRLRSASNKVGAYSRVTLVVRIVQVGAIRCGDLEKWEVQPASLDE